MSQLHTMGTNNSDGGDDDKKEHFREMIYTKLAFILQMYYEGRVNIGTQVFVNSIIV